MVREIDPSEIEFAGTNEGLHEGFLAAERRLSDAQAPVALVLDDSDGALAAAITALKLGLAVRARPAAREAPSVNGRLIAILTGD